MLLLMIFPIPRITFFWSYSHRTLKRKKKKREKQKSPKRKLLKIKAENDNTEIRRAYTKVDETKSWFSKKINKIDKTLARVIRKKRERKLISSDSNKRNVITSESTDIKGTISHELILGTSSCCVGKRHSKEPLVTRQSKQQVKVSNERNYFFYGKEDIETSNMRGIGSSYKLEKKLF